jgi:hypothetical protein
MRPTPSFLPQPPESWAGPGRVQLRTLVLLRWLAVAGQTAALLYVRYGLGFDVPLAAGLDQGLVVVMNQSSPVLADGVADARPENGLARAEHERHAFVCVDLDKKVGAREGQAQKSARIDGQGSSPVRIDSVAGAA